MTLQVQCPNCGGYRTSSSRSRVDQITRKRVGGPWLGCLTLLVIPAVFIIILIAIAGFGILFPHISEIPILGYSLGIFFLVLLLLVPFIVYGKLAYIRRRKINLLHPINTYRSECSLCGYSWQWDEGKPRHVLQVRPDLIQRGAKKLEEDAAAAAAAYYWQQQQNKKKK